MTTSRAGLVLVCVLFSSPVSRAQVPRRPAERTGAALALASAGAFAPAEVRATAPAADSPADAVDDVVRDEMRRRQIPGLSLAIIEGGKIVKATGYGVVEKGREEPVTASTLFQAGSISKPVAALGALRLVEAGKLALDDDVNTKLTTWKVPENEFTREKKVTLRGLLSHSAGLTVHGFPGYPTDVPVPTLVQVLDGEKPANTQPIRVDVLPGSRWRYSGGGYTVMQQMVIDVTGKPFPEYMNEAVLAPFGMSESTYEQPLPPDKAKLTATGHWVDRSLVKGRWHIYPEMAAAGLWTTPSDLARFAIGVQQALAGESDGVISQKMARQLVTNQKGSSGLGVMLESSGHALRFSHGGRDEGFDALLIAYAETGQGAAIMINANDNSRAVSRILAAIGKEYHWPGLTLYTPPPRETVSVPESVLDTYAGRYELTNNGMLTISADGGRLFTTQDGFADDELVPLAEDRFAAAHQNLQVTFLKDADGHVSGLEWKEWVRQRKAPRIGPLFHTLKPQTDPDSPRTEKVLAAMQLLAAGEKAIADSPLFTPGARHDFTGNPHPGLEAPRALVFLLDQDVADVKMERHKGAVSRVLHYRLQSAGPDRGLLVYLTADGLITDYDVVVD